MNPKARITYRFDQTGKLAPSPVPSRSPGALETDRPEAKSSEYTDKRRVNASNDNKGTENTLYREPLEFTTEFVPWESPFQDDVKALEQLIRDMENAPEDKGKGLSGNVIPDTSIKPDAGARPELSSKSQSRGGPHSGANPQSPSEVTRNMGGFDSAEHYPYFDVYSNGFEREAPYEAEHSLFTGPIIELDDEYEALHDRKKLFFASARLKGRQDIPPKFSGAHPGKGPSWLKVIATVAGALATGALFGYMALAMFAGEDVLPDGAAGNAPAAQSDAGRPPAQANGGSADGTAGGEAAANTPDKAAGQDGAAAQKNVKVDGQIYQLLQYGVFRTSESADEAAEQLRSKGFAASAVSMDGGYRVYAGVAGDRDGALALAGQLPGVEVYIKEVEVQPLSSISYRGDAAAFNDFALATNRLIRALSDLSQAQLMQDQPSAVSEAATQAWTELHRKWTTQLAPVRKGVAAEAAVAAVDKLAQAVNSAAVSMDSYNKKPSRASMWTLQGALMDALFAEKELFGLIRAL
ncbi:SPOR domain-containing protein [Paenibacillus beijingensis]|uniref:SPOR domain-containing protein n=1 Tax=Paenibacillus beijingensis TaxID=1126833 RepID=A0A0D5NLL9_9BACL|nr:SPOR domain-containing protein [Paenibacillus beijingensis]AJY76055.1 hypothetical protein VN24_17705 [Paenibacillus beijingensis]